jgi:hypothetical protein
MGGDARTDLLRRAEDVVAHRLDLLGSGPVDLGATIDWQLDFKSGRRWPLRHISRVRITYPDDSDIKVPWELTRCQHLPLLPAAHLLTGDRRYVDELGAQLERWIEANPVEFGVGWSCTMDVAIRAVNWIAALALTPERTADEQWITTVLGSLLQHGRFIRSHLEYSDARGNHYLSDVVGLLVVSSLFGASPEGQGWARWSVRELGREMRHQVRGDGCDHEASLSYHRLVTELFVIGTDAADAVLPGALDAEVRIRLDRMLDFVADYTRPDGLAPQIGDADDGRLLPLGDYGAADQRSHLHLFWQAGRPYSPTGSSVAYPDGGFYLMRAGELFAAVRCGDVGIYGRGCHAHNDLLAFELCWKSTPLIVDPGSYLYTADPRERNRFRSTAAHSTLQVDEAEQNELRGDRLFTMIDRARPEVLEWTVRSTATTLCGRHHGFEALPVPATHTRTLCLDGERRWLEVIDEVVTAGPHQLTLNFPLSPCEVKLKSSTVSATFGGVTLLIETDGLAPSIERGWLSPRYGVRIEAPVVRLRGPSEPGRYVTRLIVRSASPPPSRPPSPGRRDRKG